MGGADGAIDVMSAGARIISNISVCVCVFLAASAAAWRQGGLCFRGVGTVGVYRRGGQAGVGADGASDIITAETRRIYLIFKCVVFYYFYWLPLPGVRADCLCLCRGGTIGACAGGGQAGVGADGARDAMNPGTRILSISSMYVCKDSAAPQHTRVHAHTGPRRHARALACCRRHIIPRRVRLVCFIFIELAAAAWRQG